MPATRSLVCPILVGRDDLLDLADRRIVEVRGGRGEVLLLAGEAGVGKTRLLGAIERRATAAGFRSLRGGTYPSDLQVPAAIFIDLGRAMLRQDGMVTLGDALAERLDDRQPARGDAHRRRRLLVLDVAEILAGVARDGPAILALEDLHWSDDLTLEILEALARRAAELPLLVVGTYRSDELFPRVPMRAWRARLLSQRLAEEVRLARLTPEDTARMATLLIETGLPVARDVAAAVHARTDGIPLHVEELLAVLAEGGVDVAGAVRDAAIRCLVSLLLHRLPAHLGEVEVRHQLPRRHRAVWLSRPLHFASAPTMAVPGTPASRSPATVDAPSRLASRFPSACSNKGTWA